VGFLFVYEISPQPLNGFAPNSHCRRSDAFKGRGQRSKVKGQGHQGLKRYFRPFRRPACVLCLAKHLQPTKMAKKNRFIDGQA